MGQAQSLVEKIGWTSNQQNEADQAGPPRAFAFRKLKKKTKNFASDECIGQGGFSYVYKAKIKGRKVAVKRIKPRGAHRNTVFDMEFNMLSPLHHPNIIRLIGYCNEGVERLLVYEYITRGCLYEHLHSRPAGVSPMSWNSRMTVMAGVARGLNYLHNEASPPVIYCDMKPQNILIGDGFHAKIADFGFAANGVSTPLIGASPAYMAHENAVTGLVTRKSDVYSFGVVLLEVITGRRAVDMARGYDLKYLADWMRTQSRTRSNFVRLADGLLMGQFEEEMLEKAMRLGLRCTHRDPDSRPDMTYVSHCMDILLSHDPNASGDVNWPADLDVDPDEAGPSNTSPGP